MKDAEQNLPLLEDENQDRWHRDYLSSSKFEFVPRCNRVACSLLCILVVYSILLTGIMLVEKWRPDNGLPYTPAQHVINFQAQDVANFPSSIYSHPPSPVVDEAWKKLIQPIYYPASKEDIELNGEDPAAIVRLANGGYFSTFGIYHELHCVRRMYWHLHKEKYFPNRTEAAETREIGHLRHCIELMLRSLKCTPNTALYSFHFDPSRSSEPFIFSTGKRQCIDWEVFHGWAAARAVDYDPSPKLLAPDSRMKELKSNRPTSDV